ncbi:hypothetical protein [Lacticaseibacillus nasuensis]|uniref:hypothetical protein n=1 Tax=Lacticaseibacillus nasuensis TaxID=944671 RepID=UPI000A8FF041
MLDMKLIRQQPDWVKTKLGARGIKPEEIDELLVLDEKRRSIIVQTEDLKAKRNQVSGEIAQKKARQGTRRRANQGDAGSRPGNQWARSGAGEG